MLPPCFPAPNRRLLALATVMLAGCAAVPDLGNRPEPLTPAAIAAKQSLPVKGEAIWPGDGWWSAYGDPQLTTLIEEGLGHSPDLAVAMARYRRASALAGEAGARLLPSLSAEGAVGFSQATRNNGYPAQFVALMPQGWLDNGQIALSMDFDIDLWGKNRAALAAATSEARAAQYDARQARLLLATGIASAYINLAQLFEERDIARDALNVRTATQELVARRLAQGLETRGSLRQADAGVAGARGDLAAVDQAIGLRRNQIAALLGAGPDRGLSLTRPALASANQSGLPNGVTTDLVGRRADIAAARERVEAAAQRIKVAHADFFPAISLNGLIGLQSVGLGNLIDSGSTFGNVGPALSLPLFRGGALQSRYRGAGATYDEAVADYDRTVIAAYHEVADAVTSQRQLGLQLAEARTAQAASEDAYAIARKRYEGGLSTYLDVLAVEDRLLLARHAVAGLEAGARTLEIALIRSLGGGFAVPADARIPKEVPHG